MLITHALHTQKSYKTQTPKRKIKHIASTKNNVLNGIRMEMDNSNNWVNSVNPSLINANKNLSMVNPSKIMAMNPKNNESSQVISNISNTNNVSSNRNTLNSKQLMSRKLSLNSYNNKQNQNPNIRKSPNNRQCGKQSPIIQHNSRQSQSTLSSFALKQKQKVNTISSNNVNNNHKQSRTKSLYYHQSQSYNFGNQLKEENSNKQKYNKNPSSPSISASNLIVRQSPIKKILFVKNLAYNKSKSKNLSLDSKSSPTDNTSKFNNDFNKSNSQNELTNLNLNNNMQTHQNQKDKQNNTCIPFNDFTNDQTLFINRNGKNSRMCSSIINGDLSEVQSFKSYCINNNNWTTINKEINKQNYKEINKEFNKEVNKEINKEFNKEVSNENKERQNGKQPMKTYHSIYSISRQKDNKQSLSSKKKRNTKVKIIFKDLDSNLNVNEFNSDGFQYCSLNKENDKDQSKYESKQFTQTDQKKQGEGSTLIQTKSVNFEETCQNLSQQLSQLNLNSSKDKGIQSKFQQQSKSICCHNHPQKQAKFKLNQQTVHPYYCSKCTVFLVTQGYNIQENLEKKSTRLEKIKNLVFKIDMQEPKIKQQKLNICQIQDMFQRFRKNSQSQVKKYYRKLIDILLKHEQNSLNALRFYSQKTNLQIQELGRVLKENEQQISFMKSDILPNIDLIVNKESLPQNSFNQIILEHSNKFNSIMESVKKVTNATKGKQNKIIIKIISIPEVQIKSALNYLERTQIVFKDKILKFQSDSGEEFYSKPQATSMENFFSNFNNKKKQRQNIDMDQTKRSFSFDEENIDTIFYHSSQKKQRKSVQIPCLKDGLKDSIRLSFGKQFNSSDVKSPSFKRI